MGKHKPRTWPDVDEPLPASVIDNHTHLPLGDWEIPKAEGARLSLPEQLQRADAVGVTRMISSYCEVPDWGPGLELAAMYPQVRVSLGLHPNDAPLHAGHADPSPDGMVPSARPWHQENTLEEALETLDSYLNNPLVVAVGETGLDYYRTAEPGREAQKQAFRAQIAMAKAHDLPMQIHDRDAHQDCIDVLLQDGAPRHTVFHCFSGDAQMAEILAQNGWYASFAGPITYPSNLELRKAFAAMPPHLVLLETDAPYLTPAPWRGCPNASYVSTHTVRMFAQLWDCGLETACNRITENTEGVYGTWGV
ncbi:MAG: TatD family hydrolase [Actinomycetaceae bacterium]|nr:TatD family hydrolase [Actinomycetaceae bacterium]